MLWIVLVLFFEHTSFSMENSNPLKKIYFLTPSRVWANNNLITVPQNIDGDFYPLLKGFNGKTIKECEEMIAKLSIVQTKKDTINNLVKTLNFNSLYTSIYIKKKTNWSCSFYNQERLKTLVVQDKKDIVLYFPSLTTLNAIFKDNFLNTQPFEYTEEMQWLTENNLVIDEYIHYKTAEGFLQLLVEKNTENKSINFIQELNKTVYIPAIEKGIKDNNRLFIGLIIFNSVTGVLLYLSLTKEINSINVQMLSVSASSGAFLGAYIGYVLLNEKKILLKDKLKSLD